VKQNSIDSKVSYCSCGRGITRRTPKPASTADLGASRAADEELLSIAQEQERLFMTRDRDFGGLVFVRALGAGIIYLRILPSTINAVHAERARVLQSYSEEDLHKAFVVVEPGRHRFRRISQ
jgi:predicted nuclease of predicted toxin-antitoxin system